jgi:hypothetical protein
MRAFCFPGTGVEPGLFDGASIERSCRVAADIVASGLRCQALPRIAVGGSAAAGSLARSEEMPGPRRRLTGCSARHRRRKGARHLLVRAGPSPFAMRLDRGRGNAWHRNPEGCVLAPQPRRRRARLRCQASPRIAAHVAAAGRSMARSEEMPGPRRRLTGCSARHRRRKGARHLLVRAGPSLSPCASIADEAMPGAATPKAARGITSRR